MNKLIDSIPGQGKRTYISVILLVIILLAQQYGFVVDSFDADFIGAVKAILGGLAFIFLRAGK